MSDQNILDKPFDPSLIEHELYQYWEKSGFFAPRGDGKPYSIVIPPPNVTGVLHLGHGFQMTLMDTLIRFHRMDGRETLWQTGTDHAGIATQMLVTEQLLAQGIRPTEIGRDRFVEHVWKWRTESGGTITHQMRRLGTSVDWSRERFTMDEGFSKAVIEVFLQLYKDGLIYRGERLVNWDPVLKTAISDLEVVTEEEDGHLWHLRYPLVDDKITNESEDYLVVATTRPETMLGDTAVAVHPDDSRYSSLIGSSVILPLVNKRLPIIADEHVDPEFGTGCLKITPGHDFDDHEVGRRHNLPLISIFTADAKINGEAPHKYRGMDRFLARETIVEDLRTAGLLDSIDDYKIQIPRGERSGAIVEPRMTDQWFVDIKPLAQPAIEAVKSGAIKFTPERWKNVYFAWMNDIKDWCISRQQWWGHRIPAWYDDNGKIYVGRSEEEIRSEIGLPDSVNLTQDPDVLETWFSSALWTFGTMGWPDKTDDFEKFHPTDVLVTGHDIIFFWIARMIMMTLRFTGQIPFKNVYITGLIRDAEGRKMSKTLANGIDPMDLIDGIDLDSLINKRTQNLTQPRMATHVEKTTRREFPHGFQAFGTDAVRFSFCAIASPASNYNFDLSRVEGYYFFCNKLWNAAKFVLANVSEEVNERTVQRNLSDRWIRSRVNRLISNCRTTLGDYRFDLYASNIYQFAWHEFCDWYLEMAKVPLFDDSAEETTKHSTEATLIEMLIVMLKVIHPVMPYITETIWNQLPAHSKTQSSLMLSGFPTSDPKIDDPDAEAIIGWFQNVTTAIRNLRSVRQIPPKNRVHILFHEGTSLDRKNLEHTGSLLSKITKLASSRWLDNDQQPPVGSIQIVGDLKIILPFSDKEEIANEVAKLQKQLSVLDKDLVRAESKLANENFVTRAAPHIVEQERENLRLKTSQKTILQTQLDELGSVQEIG